MVLTKYSTVYSASTREAAITPGEPGLRPQGESGPIAPRPNPWAPRGDRDAGPARRARPAPGSGPPAPAPSTRHRLAACALLSAGALYGASTEPLAGALSTGVSPSA